MGARTFARGLCPWTLAVGVAGLVACEASPPGQDTADTRGQQGPDARSTSTGPAQTVEAMHADAGPSCDVDACNDRGQCVELVQWAKCDCLPSALPECPPPPRFREIGPSILYMISGDGLTVAGISLPYGSSGGQVGVTWTWQGGLMVLAQDPLGPTFPTGISFDGQVLSGYIDLPEGEEPPVVWRQGQLKRAPNGELPMGVEGSGTSAAVPDIAAIGVSAASADGQTVFGVMGDSAPIAAIWTEEDGVRAVRDVLVEAGIDMSRWTLSRVIDCSQDGKTFFGLGSTGFYSAHWIVDLP